ncbi:MAG: hypothetical protein NTV94_03475 [Planctomycetota bacterium]|nr:hypothetical protein [Planctomycetota bacterium]
MPVDLSRLYQAFDPAPLTPGQQTSLYVDLAKVRGEHEVGGVANSLAQHMRLASGPTCQLLTGHRGSGKSTELYRLEAKLGEGQRKTFVVFCDIDQALNRNDLDFPDLLLAIVRQLAEQLKAKAGIMLKPGYFQDRFGELMEFLGADVAVDRMELTYGLAKIVGTLKNSPKSRQKSRDMLEPKVDSLLYAANDLIAEAKKALVAKGFADLAIIVDNTDHMSRPSGEGADALPGKPLFINRYPEVSGFDCHIVYAVPLELAFSVCGSELKRLYGRTTPVVGIAKVQTRNGQPYAAGVDCFREVIAKRVAFAGTTGSEVFASDAVRDDLIARTGGQPLELCSLIRECMLGGLPIQAKRLTEVVVQEQRSYAKWLKRGHWAEIERIRAGEQPIPDDTNGAALRDLIEGRAILYHQNGDAGFSISPLVGLAPAGL